MTNDNTFTQPMFVYGTLQPGFGLYHLIEDGPTARGCARGSVYSVDPYLSYPVAKFAKGDTTDRLIWGTVVWCDPTDPGFKRACGIELGAGYEALTVTVWLEDGRQVECLAWHYRRPVGAPHKPLIESGDWAEEVGLDVR